MREPKGELWAHGYRWISLCMCMHVHINSTLRGACAMYSGEGTSAMVSNKMKLYDLYRKNLTTSYIMYLEVEM